MKTGKAEEEKRKQELLVQCELLKRKIGKRERAKDWGGMRRQYNTK